VNERKLNAASERLIIMVLLGKMDYLFYDELNEPKYGPHYDKGC
jgi:hypothetical protein